ncbi:MAG: permease-like cell division protein FtsX [Saprospiraceae bacterium]
MSKTSKPTKFYSTVSTSIVLVLISLFLLVFFHSNNITNIVKENINILVELEDKLPSGQIEHIKNTIAAYDGVISTSVAYLSKESALTLMSKELTISQTESENPFKDLIKFNLSNEKYSEDKIKEIKSKIEIEKGVLGLYFENDSVELVKSNLQKVSVGILALALCFVFLAMAIIFNTVKLTLYSDIKQIKTMQMVGAENRFIKKPYLLDAFWTSVKALIAVILFIGLSVTFLIKSNSIFAEIIQWKYVGLTIILSFIAAFFITVTTTNSIINQFLKKEGR